MTGREEAHTGSLLGPHDVGRRLLLLGHLVAILVALLGLCPPEHRISLSDHGRY